MSISNNRIYFQIKKREKEEDDKNIFFFINQNEWNYLPGQFILSSWYFSSISFNRISSLILLFLKTEKICINRHSYIYFRRKKKYRLKKEGNWFSQHHHFLLLMIIVKSASFSFLSLSLMWQSQTERER